MTALNGWVALAAYSHLSQLGPLIASLDHRGVEREEAFVVPWCRVGALQFALAMSKAGVTKFVFSLLPDKENPLSLEILRAPSTAYSSSSSRPAALVSDTSMQSVLIRLTFRSSHVGILFRSFLLELAVTLLWLERCKLGIMRAL